jgi:hypothetical protein
MSALMDRWFRNQPMKIDPFAIFGRLPEDENGDEEEEVTELTEEEIAKYNRPFQPLFSPFWPQFNRVLTMPKRMFREGAYTFKVSVADCWRRIEIPAHDDLDSLVSTILDSIGFDHDHLYEVSFQNSIGTTTKIFHPYMDDALYQRSTGRRYCAAHRPGDAGVV